VKSEGKASNGSPKPDGIEDAGSVSNPEKCIVVVRKGMGDGGRSSDYKLCFDYLFDIVTVCREKPA
jgi:hypothetical protein